MKKVTFDFLDPENAAAMVDLIADPETTESLRIKLIRRILETKHSENFFKTMFEENLSYGACPKCGHENHWLIPETELNKFGFASHETDENVPQFTNKESCNLYAEACKKKKVIV